MNLCLLNRFNNLIAVLNVNNNIGKNDSLNEN